MSVVSALPGANRPRSRARRVSVAVAAVALGALLAAGVAVPANAAKAPAPSLTLTVTAGGVPVANAAITIYESYTDEEFPEDGTYLDSAGLGSTDAEGHITLNKLHTKQPYVLSIDRPEYDAPANVYENGWVGKSLTKSSATKPATTSEDFTTAGSFTLAGPTSTTVALSLGGTISGDLAAPDGRAFEREFSATALRLTPRAMTEDDWDAPAPTYTHETNVYVDAHTGHYTLSGLRSGTYVLQFDQGDEPQWSTKTFNVGQPSLAAAAKKPFVFNGKTGVQNGALLEAGVVSGTVSFSPAIEPDAYPGQVELYSDRVPTTDGPGELYAAAQIAADGSYSFTGVAPGSYAVKFNEDGAASSDRFYSEWYNNAITASKAELVPVVAGGTAIVNEELGKGFSLDGIVTSSSGAPMAGVLVDLYNPASQDDNQYLETETDAAGHYSFSEVAPSSYLLSFTDAASVYPTTYYSATRPAGTTSESRATQLTYTEGTHTVDFAYPALSSLTISASSASGAVVSSVDVELVPVTNGHASLIESIDADAVPGKKGSFRATGLSVGQQYAVHFATSYFDQFLAKKTTPPVSLASIGSYDQFLGGSTQPAESTLITATEGSHTLQATLATRSGISGIVRNSKGKALPYTSVTLYRWLGSTWQGVDTTETSRTGKYAFPALEAGSYTLGFGDVGYTDELGGLGSLIGIIFGGGGFPGYSGTTNGYAGAFAGGATSIEGARAFSIAPGKSAVYNTTLVSGGTITGTVTGAGGARLEYATVTPYRLIGTAGAWTSSVPYYGSTAETNSKGAFTLTGLPAGTYALSYNAPTDDDGQPGRFGTLFADPTVSADAATYVVRAAKSTASGTAVLPLSTDVNTAHINGTITPWDASFSGGVYVFNLKTGVVAALEAQDDGTFTGDLPPGTYSYLAFAGSDESSLSVQIASGSFTVAAGDNAVPIALEEDTALRFTEEPKLTTQDTVVGTTYSVNATWNNPVTSLGEYQWLRDGKPITDATADTYTSGGRDLGHTLSVEVSVTSLLFGDEIQGEATLASPVTASATLASTAAPRITSSAPAAPGVTLRASAGTWSVEGVTLSYEWLNADDVVVGTGPIYVPARDAAGSQLSVRVTASKRGYTEATAGSAVAVSNFVTVGLLDAPTVKKAPKVSATAVTGGTLFTAASGTWSETGLSYSYQWNYAGEPIVGATQPSFVVDPAVYDGTQPVTVTVTASGVGLTPGETTVLARRGTAEPVALTAPTLRKTDRAFRVLPGTWRPAGGTYSYRWVRDTATTIEGRTGTVFLRSSADKGAAITVEITYAVEGHTPVVTTLLAQKGAAPRDRDGAIVSAGDGDGLTIGDPIGTTKPSFAYPDGATPAATVQYQWYAAGKKIVGATQETLRPANAYVGKTLTLKVISRSPYFITGSYITSGWVQHAVVGTIGAVESTTAPTLVAAGTPSAGVALTVKPGTWQSGTTLSYRWLRNGIVIPGATTTTYTPLARDYGSEISVAVTGSAVNYSNTVVTTNSLDIELAAAPVAKVAPKITGTPTVGLRLTATPGTWKVEGLAFGYVWKSNGVAIAGATDNHFTPTATEKGTTITVTVIAVRNGYATGEATSPSTALVR